MKTVIEQLRTFADELEASTTPPALPTSIDVLGAVDHMQAFVPKGSIEVIVEWNGVKPLEVRFRVYESSNYSYLSNERTMPAALANAIRSVESRRATEAAATMQPEQALEQAIPEPVAF